MTLIYEKNGLSARLAYNWRDKYLGVINRGCQRNPVFFAPFGTLDLSISYDISSQFAVSFDALNLTSEPMRRLRPRYDQPVVRAGVAPRASSWAARFRF